MRAAESRVTPRDDENNLRRIPIELLCAPERESVTVAVAEPEPGRNDDDEMFRPFE